MNKLGLGLGGWVLVLAALPLLLFQGCRNSPPAATGVVPPPMSANTISDFPAGTLNVNPNLTNGKGGFFTAETNGGTTGQPNEIDGSVNPNILYPRADTGLFAVHIYGTQTDTIPTGYPSMELFCFLRNNPGYRGDPYLYDLSGFTGVQFDMLVPPDDTNTQRWFEIGISLDTPAGTSPGGTCPAPYGSNCYNYFNLGGPSGQVVAGTSTSWQHVQAPFSNMIIRFTPGAPNPVGLTTADNLTGSMVVGGQTVSFESQALFLLWQFSDGGNPPGSTSYTDYWVDNVEFY